MSLLSHFGSLYHDYLETYPLATKSITTAVIGVIGDAAAQLHEVRLRAGNTTSSSSASHTTKVFSLDSRRCLASIANNLFLTAPIYHFGYAWLDNMMPVGGDDADTSSVMGSSMAALAQVLVDCILFDALFVFLMYVSSVSIEGYHSNDDALNHPIASMKRSLLPAIFASWKVNIFMIPIEFILFRYFPLRLRVLGMNFIDLVWEAVVSFSIHTEGSNSGEETESDHSENDEDEQVISPTPSSCLSSSSSERLGGNSKQKQS